MIKNRFQIGKSGNSSLLVKVEYAQVQIMQGMNIERDCSVMYCTIPGLFNSFRYRTILN